MAVKFEFDTCLAWVTDKETIDNVMLLDDLWRLRLLERRYALLLWKG